MTAKRSSPSSSAPRGPRKNTSAFGKFARPACEKPTARKPAKPTRPSRKDPTAPDVPDAADLTIKPWRQAPGTRPRNKAAEALAEGLPAKPGAKAAFRKDHAPRPAGPKGAGPKGAGPWRKPAKEEAAPKDPAPLVLQSPFPHAALTNGQGCDLVFASIHMESELEAELQRQGTSVLWRQGRVFLVAAGLPPPLWSATVWRRVKIAPIASIGAAQRFLKELGRDWSYYALAAARRGTLILEGLPARAQRRLDFNQPLPCWGCGGFSLLADDQLLYAAETTHPLPLGMSEFVEQKALPPSRAYLKLWELFTVHGVKPEAGWRCLDMGSCPGGWTWVLQNMGCHVVSVDKAPLAEQIAALPRITFLQESAFGLDPASVGPVDCFYSDIICYPARLLELVRRWHASGMVKRFVCTIKFQGPTDYAALAEFAAFPGARILHLHHNKHEVTWIWQDPALAGG